MQIQIYYTIVFISAIYFFHKNGINRISLLVFFVFWEGLFNYLDEFTPFFWNSYKIFFFLFILFFSLSIKGKDILASETKLNTIYIFFSVSFFITFLINSGDIFTILSQFLFKYSSIIFLFYIIKELLSYKSTQDYLQKLLFFAISIQIFLSFIKIIILGFMEQNVGSVEYGSGGTAVILPLITLFFFSSIEIHKKFKIGKLVYILPLIIAIASMKRTPIFLYPIYFFFLVNFIEKNTQIKNILKYSPIVFLLFYFGVKLNPTLNPEHSIWGTFDFNYVTDYGLTYNFGTSDISQINNSNSTSGRGGSLFLFFQPNKIALKETTELLFGHGLMDAAVKTKGRFLGGLNYGIQHNGLMSSTIILLYSLGFTGLLSLFLLNIYIFFKTNDKYIRWLLISLYLYEFLFYANQMMINHASIILVLYVIFYSNSPKTNQQQANFNII